MPNHRQIDSLSKQFEKPVLWDAAHLGDQFHTTFHLYNRLRDKRHNPLELRAAIAKAENTVFGIELEYIND